MAVDPPPIQEKTTRETGEFPQIWSLWFEELRRQVNDIDGGSA